jgi:hypothetical protein
LKTITACDALWRGFVVDLVRVTSGLTPLASEVEFMVTALQARIGAGERSVTRLWLEEKSSFSFLSTCLEALKPLRPIPDCDCAELARCVVVHYRAALGVLPCAGLLVSLLYSLLCLCRELLGDDAAYGGDYRGPVTPVSVARGVRVDMGAAENLVTAVDCCAVMLLHHAMTQDRYRGRQLTVVGGCVCV